MKLSKSIFNALPFVALFYPASARFLMQDLENLDKDAMNAVNIEFSAPTTCHESEKLMSVDIVQDNRFGENLFMVTDSVGDAMFYGFNSGIYCLPADSCYTFTIFDYKGDGMCCNEGFGNYTLSWDGEIIKQGGKFGSIESTKFGSDALECPDPIYFYISKFKVYQKVTRKSKLIPKLTFEVRYSNSTPAFQARPAVWPYGTDPMNDFPLAYCLTNEEGRCTITLPPHNKTIYNVSARIFDMIIPLWNREENVKRKGCPLFTPGPCYWYPIEIDCDKFE